MWWIMLVAGLLMKALMSFLDPVVIVVSYIHWLSTPPKVKWKMKGAYPKTWMILSATMLLLQFVGCYCGSHWDCTSSFAVHLHVPQVHMDWFSPQPRKPPDPSCNPRHVPPTDPKTNTVYHVNTNNVYTVSSRATKNAKKGSLVDCGANGGLAGCDVCVLYKTDRQVDVQGIDDHQLVNIPIVTAAGVITT